MENKLFIIYENNTKELPIEVWVDDKLVWDGNGGVEYKLKPSYKTGESK